MTGRAREGFKIAVIRHNRSIHEVGTNPREELASHTIAMKENIEFCGAVGSQPG